MTASAAERLLLSRIAISKAADTAGTAGTAATAGSAGNSDAAGVLLPRAIGARSTGARSAVASHGQEQLWLIDQINPGSREYVYPESVRLTGPVDPEALRTAFVRLAERHEILRTRFVLDDDGVVVQHIDNAPRVPFAVCELPVSAGGDLAALADRQVRELVAEPFDLEQGPVLRMRLTRIAADEHLLTFVVHHVVCDGWSLGVIARELPVHYTAARLGRASELPPLAIQYSDFSTWQRSEAQESRLEPQIAFWRKYLADLAPLELPLDLPRPEIRTGDGEALRFPLPGRLSARVSELAREQRVTPYMVYLAGYQLLLSRWTGGDDIAVSTPVSGRVRAETEDLIGYFVNTVVVRTDVSGAPSFVDCLALVRTACLDAFSHQDVPFARVVDELRVAPDLSRAPIAQHAFVYSTGLRSRWDLPGVRCEHLRPEMHIAKSDLSLSLSDSESGGSVRVEYSTDLFHASTAEAFGRQYLDLLDSVLSREGTP